MLITSIIFSLFKRHSSAKQSAWTLGTPQFHSAPNFWQLHDIRTVVLHAFRKHAEHWASHAAERWREPSHHRQTSQSASSLPAAAIEKRSGTRSARQMWVHHSAGQVGSPAADVQHDQGRHGDREWEFCKISHEHSDALAKGLQSSVHLCGDC